MVNAATGQPTFPQGIAAGAPAGFRNRLRNASFAINQRAVSGTVTLAAGAYGHDGVKAGASGATYTFATSGLDTTITVTSGSLILPIEASLVEGGAYALSHAGTAQARVWQGDRLFGLGELRQRALRLDGTECGQPDQCRVFDRNDSEAAIRARNRRDAVRASADKRRDGDVPALFRFILSFGDCARNGVAGRERHRPGQWPNFGRRE